jgi:hypothetical protein
VRISRKDKEGLFHEMHVDLVWYGRREIRKKIRGDCGSFPCIQDYDYFRLDVAIIVFLGKKCVCDMGEKGGKYGNRMYSCHCNEKWLMDSHNSYWCLVLFRVWKERRE